MDNPRVKAALVEGQVPPSAWNRHLRYVEQEVRDNPKIKNQLAYAISMITNYVNDPIWDETVAERNARGRTDYEPG